MAKKKENLSPIPKPRPPRTPAAATQLSASESPDLSHIAEGLRPLAVPVGELTFFADNPRSHGEKDLAATRASLARFGQVEPLVVNRRRMPPVVLNGNGRLQGALSLGWSHVAVHFIDVDDATANALAVTLNRTGEMASWDRDALEKLLADVSTGCDERLDAMLSELATEMNIVPADGESSAAGKEIEEVPVKPPPGIAWILLGIPFDVYGDVQHHVAALQEAATIHCQSNRDPEHNDGSQANHQED